MDRQKKSECIYIKYEIIYSIMKIQKVLNGWVNVQYPQLCSAVYNKQCMLPINLFGCSNIEPGTRPIILTLHTIRKILTN